jgi:excisionase family DNA binding protein
MNATATAIYRPHMATIKEAAKMFGLSEFLVRNLAKEGKIRAIRAGKSKIYVNTDSLGEHLATSSLRENGIQGEALSAYR